jgi:2-dehydro-3-deoxygluconokinase
MLRLDPGERRIRTTRSFDVWDSGAEYNVARAFRRSFGLRGALISAFTDNEVGRLLEDIMLGSGVDLSFVRWEPFDGIGRQNRNGLNFAERGFGLRGALGCVDRAYTAISQLRPGQIDLAELFGRRRTRLFHSGGIMAGLSDVAAQTTLEVIRYARANGAIVSYDLNYRPSLWAALGGQRRCQEVNRVIAQEVDVLLGNEEDFTACLGLQVAGLDADLTQLNRPAYRDMVLEAAATWPNLKAIGVTLRRVRSANLNDWGALGWVRPASGSQSADAGFADARQRNDLAILDRLGGGDSFASGFLYGLLELSDLKAAVEYGAANGALAMTTPGDTTTATLAEIERLVAGGSARVQR